MDRVISPPADSRVRVDVTLGSLHLQLALELPGSGICALFGPSGSGKTSLLRLLAGLERWPARVEFGGRVYQDSERGIFVPPHQRPVGYVFQEASLFPHLDVRANLEYGYRRNPRARLRLPFEQILELLGIGQLLSRSVDRLSGGERKRIAIARALLRGPELLLLDEPLAELDWARRAEILPYLERLRDELSLPMIYVSHSIEEVARLADHLVLIESGHALASGPVESVLTRLDVPTAHSDEASAILTGEISAHDPEDQLTRIEIGNEHLWVSRIERPLGTRLRARILARDVSLSRERPAPTSILNLLHARVVEISDDGPSRVNVQLILGDGSTRLLSRITRRSRAAL
ncbi:MAG TPA: molybdenum ABC transporter ATP-binding protein, partial [Polyangiaceae bacterium]|nr:molybdenum ABC transporter ATP-binding protein [Polyangiaceae bacterium]